MVPILLALLVLLVAAGVVILWMQGRAREPIADSRPASGSAPEQHGQSASATLAPTLGPVPPSVSAPTVREPIAEQTAEADEPVRAGVNSGSTSEILPDSSNRRLTRSDLASLSAGDLFLARNEIFARHGRLFRNPVLQRHFSQLAWYRPQPGAVRLSAVETANVAMISREEKMR